MMSLGASYRAINLRLRSMPRELPAGIDLLPFVRPAFAIRHRTDMGHGTINSLVELRLAGSRRKLQVSDLHCL